MALSIERTEEQQIIDFVHLLTADPVKKAAFTAHPEACIATSGTTLRVQRVLTQMIAALSQDAFRFEPTGWWLK